MIKEVCLCHTVYLCGLNVTCIRTQGALNERALSKESIIPVLGLKKSGSDVQAHEVIMDKDILSSQSGGKKMGNGERKSNNP